MTTRDGAVSVVFENALIVDSSAWAWVTMALDGVQVVLRDRAPRSAVAATVASIAPHRQAEILRKMHGAFGPDDRHVVVGHSVGGLLAQYYAAVHPQNVVGMVLIDSTHPDQCDRSSIQLNAHLWLMQDLTKRIARSAVAAGLSRSEVASLDVLPAPVRTAARRSLQRRSTWITAQRETIAARGEWALQARRLRRTQIPITVLVSQEAAEQDTQYVALQRELAESSADSSLLRVPGTTHESIVMSESGAAAVADAVRDVIERARAVARG